MLILGILLAILSISCVNAIDNSTDIVKEQNSDIISISEQDNYTISVSNENESVAVAVESNSSNPNETNGDDVLTISENAEVLGVSSSGNVLASSVSVSSPTYKQPTKNQRTFNIGGYKVVLNNAQYKRLYMISPIEDYFFDEDYNYYYVGEKYRGYDITGSGLRTYVTVMTNKYVRVKLTSYKNVYYRNSRVYMMFSYGQGQSGVAYKHMAFLIHYYGYYNRYFNQVKVLGANAKYFGKCKCSSPFTHLNRSKLYPSSFIYKKYSAFFISFS